MYAIVFLLIVMGLAMLVVNASRRPSRHSLEPAPVQRNQVRGPVENPVATIFVLGSDPSLRDQASQDLEIYKDLFHTVEARSFASKYHLLTELSSRPCHIAHILAKFDDSGRVIWEEGEGDVFEVLEAFSDCGSYFVFLASGSGQERQEVTDEILRARARLEMPRVVLATLIDRGPEFAKFMRKFAKELRRGESPTIAWLKVRPQDAGGPQPAEDLGPTGLLVT